MDRVVYKASGQGRVKGLALHVLVPGATYHLADLTVYEDGSMDCLGWDLDMVRLKELFDSERLTMILPAGSRLFIPYTGVVMISHGSSPDSNLKFLDAVRSCLKHLRDPDSPDSLALVCMRWFRDFLIDPSDKNVAELVACHERLPEDKKVLFEYVAYKDPLVEFVKTREVPSAESRRLMLNDYFDGEWLEMK